jgi:hypothetical protein
MRPPAVVHVMLGGQQNGLMSERGGILNPGLFSATWPGGQQSFGSLLRRCCGQQIAFVFGTRPMFPGRIGSAHFVPAAQQTCSGPFTQQERLLGQQPALPQQREVRRSQHFVPHSSWSRRQRLHSPVPSLMQCQRGGQHVLRPHQARFGGHFCSQTVCDPTPILILRHSSFGLQHIRPQPRSPCLQQSRTVGFAQNWSTPQHENGLPQVLMHMQFDSPRRGSPHRVPGGHAATPEFLPSEPL